jgi:hypothetical protein
MRIAGEPCTYTVYTMHHAPCVMHHAPCTMHHALCTMHYARTHSYNHAIIAVSYTYSCIIHSKLYHTPILSYNHALIHPHTHTLTPPHPTHPYARSSCIVHGDYRLGNIVMSPADPTVLAGGYRNEC